MKITTQLLLKELKEQVQSHVDYVITLKEKDLGFLQCRNSRSSWNVLECLEHLNLYGEYYLPEIEKVISNSQSIAKSTYKSGWLGNYMANSMLPNIKVNKMKTFNDKNPLDSLLDKSTIDKFLDQQKRLLNLLEKAEKIDIERERIRISIARWLTMQLGDVFRFLINHDERHIIQSQKINP